LIQQYQNEIAELRAQLREKGMEGGSMSSVKGRDNDEASKRLEELKSLILNTSNVNQDRGEEVSLARRGSSGREY